MNICFLIGKIVSEIEFDFLCDDKKHDSIVGFDIETSDGFGGYTKTINRIYAYDEIADEIYSKYQKGSYIEITGYIEDGKR